MKARDTLSLSVLALATGAALAGCGGVGSGVPVLPEGRAIDTSIAVTPTTHLFGDTLTARLDVVLDRRLLEPSRVRVEAGFDPYEQVGETAVEERAVGPYVRLRHEYVLRCLGPDCIPARLESILGEQEQGRGERRTFRFAAARILYADPARKTPELLFNLRWPPVTGVSRLNEAQFGAAYPFRASPAELPPLAARGSPALIAGALVLAALLLLALPATVSVRWWRARRPPPVEQPVVVLSPLERALRLVEWACRQPDGAARRRALEALAPEVAENGRGGLDEDVRALAWSRRSPGPDDASAVVRRVREERDGG